MCTSIIFICRQIYTQPGASASIVFHFSSHAGPDERVEMFVCFVFSVVAVILFFFFYVLGLVLQIFVMMAQKTFVPGDF